MQSFARWHIWLAWLAGVPILMWTLTGLVMVAKPIENVRGDHLRAASPTIDTAELMFPTRMGVVRSVELVEQVDGPAWIVTEADGGEFRYSARDGTLIPPVIADEAQRIALAAYAGDGVLERVTYLPADLAPMDLRIPTASWQARFSDDTHLYIHSATGQVLAIRSSWWRVFDFAWGLHIMDLQTREDTSHPTLIVFAVLAALGSLLGCVLMFRRRKARVKTPPTT